MRLGPMDGVHKHAYVQSQWQPSHDFYGDYIEGTITIYNRKNLPLAHGLYTLFPYISSAGGIIAITPFSLNHYVLQRHRTRSVDRSDTSFHINE